MVWVVLCVQPQYALCFLHDLLMQCISLLKICLLSIFAGKHSCANVQRWLKHSLVPWIWFTMREVSWKNSFIRNKATGSIWCEVQFIFMCFCNLKGRIISHYRLLYMVLWKWAIAHAIYAKKEFKTNTEVRVTWNSMQTAIWGYYGIFPWKWRILFELAEHVISWFHLFS